jgi:L-threonylcarbamoyladenylate synthase
VVAALRAGGLVVLPTDTVYGLCAVAHDEAAVARISELKGRPEGMPLAVLAADFDALLAALPELPEIHRVIARAILPGPYTLLVANPARRFRALVPEGPETIGVRVPELPEMTRLLLAEAGPVAATSANRHGEPDPSRLEDVPAEILAGCAASVDGGTLPGTPSTVVDLTGSQARVLREGAVSTSEALETIARAASE